MATPSFLLFRPKALESCLTPLFLSHPYSICQEAVGSTFKIYPESDHFSPPSLTPPCITVIAFPMALCCYLCPPKVYSKPSVSIILWKHIHQLRLLLCSESCMTPVSEYKLKSWQWLNGPNCELSNLTSSCLPPCSLGSSHDGLLLIFECTY